MSGKWTDCAHCTRSPNGEWLCALDLHTPGEACAQCTSRQHYSEVSVSITPRKIIKYLSAEASLIVQGPLGAEAVEARLAACAGCEARKLVDGEAYCGACGCGTRARAALSIKATMPAATCPRGLWQPAK